MDTDDLTEMAYACIVSANEITDILKSELGAACSQFKTENEYLKEILKHVEDIENDPKDYLDDWNLLDEIDIKVFKKKIGELRRQIQETIKTPQNSRGKIGW